jgi:hypothetical protein
MIKTKLTLTTAMSIEEDLDKEDKDLSTLLGAELPKPLPLATLPECVSRSAIETHDAEPKVSAE